MRDIVAECLSDGSCFITSVCSRYVASAPLNTVSDLESRDIVKTKSFSLLERLKVQILELSQATAELYGVSVKRLQDLGCPPPPILSKPAVIPSVVGGPITMTGVQPMTCPRFPDPQASPCLSSGIFHAQPVAFPCAKLPNPIEGILSGQPSISGDSFDSFIQFLKMLVNVRVHALVFGRSDAHILLV
jgi:hypothetical protein